MPNPKSEEVCEVCAEEAVYFEPAFLCKECGDAFITPCRECGEPLFTEDIIYDYGPALCEGCAAYHHFGMA